MDHDHSNHEHHHGHGNLVMAFWLNFGFTVLEIIGGLLTNSVAILSDAVHDLGDSMAIFFAILMEKLSERKGNRKLTFGYKRFSILGAFVNALILIGGSVFVLYRAIPRLFSVEEVHVPGMILMAVIGILFNSLAVFRLRKDESLNARVVFMHLLEDVLGWASILVVSIIMFFVDLPVLDPILSMVIAVFILSRIVPTLMKTGRIFLQYKPDDQEIHLLKSEIASVDGVEDVHDVHLWTLDGINHVFSCHVVVPPELSSEQIMGLIARIKELLDEKGVGHATIEPEHSGAECVACDAEEDAAGGAL